MKLYQVILGRILNIKKFYVKNFEDVKIGDKLFFVSVPRTLLDDTVLKPKPNDFKYIEYGTLDVIDKDILTTNNTIRLWFNVLNENKKEKRTATFLNGDYIYLKGIDKTKTTVQENYSRWNYEVNSMMVRMSTIDDRENFLTKMYRKNLKKMTKQAKKETENFTLKDKKKMYAYRDVAQKTKQLFIEIMLPLRFK